MQIGEIYFYACTNDKIWWQSDKLINFVYPCWLWALIAKRIQFEEHADFYVGSFFGGLHCSGGPVQGHTGHGLLRQVDRVRAPLLTFGVGLNSNKYFEGRETTRRDECVVRNLILP